MPTLKELFSMNCKPVITLNNLQQLDKFVASYEVRDDNPLAFNTPLLGVKKAYWYQKDEDFVFEIFGTDRRTVTECVKQCGGINKSFNVISNPFNNFAIWIIYLMKQTTNISKQVIYQGCMNMLKCLHYHFFTGKVNSLFPHNAKEPVMLYTIDNLSAKSDIKNEDTDTWKKMIYRHCEVTLEPNSIYTTTFSQFAPDSAIGKSITDIHTRLCRKLVLIAEAYYEANKNGMAYTSSSLTFEDNETGLQKLGDLKGTLDIATSRVCMAVLNTNELIDQNLANLAARLTSSVRKDNVIDALTLFSKVATQQVADKETRLAIVDKHKQPLYIGYVTLVEEIIQKTYRRAALQGVDVTSDVAVLNSARNAYTASRVIDNDVNIIKNSVDLFMQQTKFTRQSTLVSLRLAFILYILMLAFKYK